MSQYMTSGERTRARKIIATAIAQGFCISVNDGEEWVVRRSQDAAAILEAMASTSDDTLKLRDKATDVCLGNLWLVYGNAPDGSELIADHSDNPAMCQFVKQTEA